jgi:uncharacterized membrane protein YdfJ with MMPL/SSD domain
MRRPIKIVSLVVLISIGLFTSVSAIGGDKFYYNHVLTDNSNWFVPLLTFIWIISVLPLIDLINKKESIKK